MKRAARIFNYNDICVPGNKVTQVPKNMSFGQNIALIIEKWFKNLFFLKIICNLMKLRFSGTDRTKYEI